MRVLLVEDDQAVAAMLRDALLALGHEPLIAPTAEDALARLQSDPANLILLDLHLPGMSGVDFLRRQAELDVQVPIVAMSGVATESQARECLRLGAVDFIGKPIALERLAEVIRCLEPRAPVEHGEQARRIERRRAPRVGVALPVRVREYDGSEWSATSINLSANGIKVRTDRSVSPGLAAKLEILLPDSADHLEVLSVLVRADLDGYAFHFANLSEWQHHRLSALVQRYAAPHTGAVGPHLRILQSISQALSRSLDVDETVRVALDALTQVTGHEIASLHLVSEDGKILRLHGDRGLLPRLRALNRELPVGEGLIGRVVATGQTIHVTNVTESAALLPAARPVVKDEGIRGFVCVPIQSDGKMLGALSLGRRTGEPFSGAEIALLEATAGQIGLALGMARLYGETRRQLDGVAEAQLLEGERLSTVGKLAAGVAHEINNRFSVILSQAQLLLMSTDPAAEYQHRLRTIVEQTSSAAQMLRSLQQLSRRDPPHRGACALVDEVRWVLEVKQHELERAGIRVVTELEPVPTVQADVNQIRQILLNLVQNAQQAMAPWPGNRRLTLRVSHANDQARVDVIDTGPGIAADALPHIFDAFFTTKPRGEGTGLGLWIAYSMMEQHGGRLTARNQAGGGAAFTLELPCERPDRSATREPAT